MRTKVKAEGEAPVVTDLGRMPAPQAKKSTWVQTERAAHEAWAKLVQTNARAASLLHVLVAHMDRSGAVVASRGTLARLVGCSEATIKRAVSELKADQWIQIVQLGGKGGVNAYVVNSRVAWADSRDRLPMAAFTARVIASAAEQDELAGPPLRAIPTLYPGERQLPTPDDASDHLPDLPALSDQSQLKLGE